MRRLELGRLLSWREAFSYWPCLFRSEEGALEEEGASSVGSTFTCQIAMRFVLEGGYSSVLDYCGGVSRSELPVGICNSFGGFGIIYEGRTMLGRSCLVWTCTSA
jgi:hypothetical protein